MLSLKSNINGRVVIMAKMGRWYDQYERFSHQLDLLRDCDEERRDEIVQGMILIIRENNASNILEDFILEFPLDFYRKRWYDQDPYLWLVINGLKHASKELIDLITEYMEKMLPEVVS